MGLQMRCQARARRLAFRRAPGHRLKAEASDAQGLVGVCRPEDMHRHVNASDHMPCHDLAGHGCERESGHLNRKVGQHLPSFLCVCARMMPNPS